MGSYFYHEDNPSQLSSPVAGTKIYRNMKKLTFVIATALLMIFLVPPQAIADAEEVKNESIETVTTDAVVETADAEEALAAESEALLARLDEINEMDKTDLTPSERRELRKEVRQIDKALTLNSGGVYLSVGAVIVIILLLILLL